MRKILILPAFLFCTYFQVIAQSQITEENGNVGIGSAHPQEKLEVKQGMPMFGLTNYKFSNPVAY